jgi:hypothetical protein
MQHGHLPKGVQDATYFIDESGSRQASTKTFVVAGIKTRRPDRLARDIKSVREKHDFHSEFKFGRLGAGSLAPALDLIDVLVASDAHLVATVVDRRYNPFKGRMQHEAQAEVIAQLVRGSLTRNEVVVALIDDIATPSGFYLGEYVKRSVNAQVRSTAMITAMLLDSKCNDLLQVADLVAGAIRNHRVEGTPGAATKPEKVRVAGTLAAAFGITDFKSDVRARRVNIKTLQAPRNLRVVNDSVS